MKAFALLLVIGCSSSSPPVPRPPPPPPPVVVEKPTVVVAPEPVKPVEPVAAPCADPSCDEGENDSALVVTYGRCNHDSADAYGDDESCAMAELPVKSQCSGRAWESNL